MPDQTDTSPSWSSLPREGGAGGRSLVVVNERVAGEELREALIAHLRQGVNEVFVVAPAIVDSGLKHTMGDVDDAIEPARARLEATLEELRSAGFEARGEVGDSDPIQAISDEILKFEPDQILVVAHRDEEGAFAEKGLLEQAERDFDLPVLELVVTREEEPEVLDVQSSHPVAGRKKGWRPTGNFPPLSRLDIFGIVVAIAGTIVLAILAADGISASGPEPDFEEGRLGFAAAARILIAIGMALINIAHVVGLLLFQSVRYEGVFSRFFARTSLYGTPIAIVVSLLLGLAI
ncbi:MAG TPA: hypothetical protein VK889_02125 [Solirubrobacterales bacterium]|nr:hypothetical protein [Solirubrobacterales bacterium]